MTRARAQTPAQPGDRLLAEPDFAVNASEMIKAVGHPIRLRLIALLCQGDAHVSALSQQTGAKQSIVSQQLRILRSHGLVRATRNEGFAYYRIAEPKLVDLVRCIEGCSLS
jgi:ArsR family transcriptional regulator